MKRKLKNRLSCLLAITIVLTLLFANMVAAAEAYGLRMNERSLAAAQEMQSAGIAPQRTGMTYTYAGISMARQNNPLLPALYDQTVRVADPFQVPEIPDVRPRLFLREGDLDGLRARRENPNHMGYRWYHGAGGGTQCPDRFWWGSVLRYLPSGPANTPANGILAANNNNFSAPHIFPMQAMALTYLLNRDSDDPAIAAQAKAYGRLAVQWAADYIRTLNLIGDTDEYRRGNNLCNAFNTLAMVYDWAYTFIHEPFVSADPGRASTWGDGTGALTHGRTITLPGLAEAAGRDYNTFGDIIHYGFHFHVDRRLGDGTTGAVRGLEFGFPGPGFDGTFNTMNGHHLEMQLWAMAAVAITVYHIDSWFWDQIYEFFFFRYFPTKNFMAEGGMNWNGSFYGPFRSAQTVKTNYIFYMMQDPGYRISFISADHVDVFTSMLYYRRPDGQNIRIGDFNDDTRGWGQKHGGLWNHLGIVFTNAIFHDPFLQNELISTIPQNAPSPILVFIAMSDVEPLKYCGILPLTYFMGGSSGEMVTRTGWPSPGLADPAIHQEFPPGTPIPANRRHELFDDDWNVDYEGGGMVVSMRFGLNTWNHDTLEAGNFQIYYRGALAIRSGVYEGFGNVHDTEWYKPTISHNSILIRDPLHNERGFTPHSFDIPHPERFTWRERNLANTGGQLFNFGAGRAWGSPRDVFRGRDGVVRYFTSAQHSIEYARGISDHGIPLGEPRPNRQSNELYWRTTSIISHAVEPGTLEPEFSFLKGDMTQMYGYRADLATRSFMFFNFHDETHPGALIVFDHITAGSQFGEGDMFGGYNFAEEAYLDFEKYWLLHTLFEPKVVRNEDDTIRHFVVEDTRRVAQVAGYNVNAINLPMPIQYNGRMIATPLLPAPHDLVFHLEDHRAERGPGGWGWSAIGLNASQTVYRGQPIPVTQQNGYWPHANTAEPGEFMIMLSPQSRAQTHHFLNVMQVHAACDSIIPLDVELVGSAGDTMVGAKITGFEDGRGFVTFFSTEGMQAADSTVRLPRTVGSNPLRHYVTDLAPGVWRVYDDGSYVTSFTVNDGENVGLFVLPGGRYTIAGPSAPSPDPFGPTNFCWSDGDITIRLQQGQPIVMTQGDLEWTDDTDYTGSQSANWADVWGGWTADNQIAWLNMRPHSHPNGRGDGFLRYDLAFVQEIVDRPWDSVVTVVDAELHVMYFNSGISGFTEMSINRVEGNYPAQMWHSTQTTFTQRRNGVPWTGEGSTVDDAVYTGSNHVVSFTSLPVQRWLRFGAETALPNTAGGFSAVNPRFVADSLNYWIANPTRNVGWNIQMYESGETGGLSNFIGSAGVRWGSTPAMFPVLYITLTSVDADAALAALTVSTGTLTPAFNPDVTEYEVYVTNSHERIQIGARVRHPLAVIVADALLVNVTPGSLWETPYLVPGVPTVFTITVVAEDGSQRVYSITVTRSLEYDLTPATIDWDRGDVTIYLQQGEPIRMTQNGYSWTGDTIFRGALTSYTGWRNWLRNWVHISPVGAANSFWNDMPFDIGPPEMHGRLDALVYYDLSFIEELLALYTEELAVVDASLGIFNAINWSPPTNGVLTIDRITDPYNTGMWDKGTNSLFNKQGNATHSNPTVYTPWGAPGTTIADVMSGIHAETVSFDTWGIQTWLTFGEHAVKNSINYWLNNPDSNIGWAIRADALDSGNAWGNTMLEFPGADSPVLWNLPQVHSPILSVTIGRPDTYIPTPVFSWNIFNNGPGGTQYPRPNAGLAEAGLIRMWALLDGVGAPVYLAATDTIIAHDQHGQCAMDFVRVGRVWVPGQGWADYFNLLDINKNGNWQQINLSITVHGQPVNVLLVNANYRPAAEYHTVTFVVEAGAVGVYAATTITVEVADGEAIPADAIPSVVARTGFYFVGWYPSDPAEYGYVTGDVTFTARFNLLWHYVTFEAGDGGTLVAADGFGLVVRIRDGFTFWPDRVPTPVADEGYEFVKWYPANPADFVVRGNVTFTAIFAEAAPVVPQILSVTPNPAIVQRGGTVELVVTTQGMPDGAWVDLNVAWRPGLSVVGGPRFYIVDNRAVITVAATANARIGRDGFAVTARAAGQWGIPFIIDSYTFVIEVVQ